MVSPDKQNKSVCFIYKTIQGKIVLQAISFSVSQIALGDWNLHFISCIWQHSLMKYFPPSVIFIFTLHSLRFIDPSLVDLLTYKLILKLLFRVNYIPTLHIVTRFVLSFLISGIFFFCKMDHCSVFFFNKVEMKTEKDFLTIDTWCTIHIRILVKGKVWTYSSYIRSVLQLYH